ncbi:hypothetical protein CHS0354_035273 [Potamilus streckersoni]|uniref:GTP-binding protein EngB n=1 Tax=Potamilus streckersoni TaxID=2493646 RepID=A0AAE0VPB0_9BIVA|nr:hypothetical protein CHS0354_035273 [Potamilus streckersoni]
MAAGLFCNSENDAGCACPDSLTKRACKEFSSASFNTASTTPSAPSIINITCRILEINTEPMDADGKLLYGEREIYCVDLPGYGYAQLSKSGRDELRQLIQDFLQHAPELKLVVQLTDMRVGATEDDVFYFRNIYQSGLPVLLIANKSDKVSASKQKSVLEKIARDVGVDELPTPFSSVTKHTLSRVRQILFSELDP